MNYSKSMKVNTKRFFIALVIIIIMTAVISSTVTALIIKSAVSAKAIETSQNTEPQEYFFTQEVKVAELDKESPEPIIQESVSKEVITKEPILTSLGEYTITAYCSCEKCCGEWAKNRPNGIVYGAAMIELEPGISIAAPKNFDFGTVIRIDDHEYVVQDRLATWIAEKYDGKIIDIYFDDHQEALKFGKQIKEIYLKEERKDQDD